MESIISRKGHWSVTPYIHYILLKIFDQNFAESRMDARKKAPLKILEKPGSSGCRA